MSDTIIAQQRPHRTSMEGMIWNAYHVLETALNPGFAGIPKEYFQRCVGICIMSLIETGFMFSGSVGTGILLAKKDDGTWSNPVACSLSGIGLGFSMGMMQKDVICFLNDQDTVSNFLSSSGVGGIRLGATTNLTLGNEGRELGISANAGPLPPIFSIGFSRGAYVSLELQGGMIQPRKDVNRGFYKGPKDEDLQPMDIIEGKVDFPTDRVTLLPQLLQQLEKLSQGKANDSTSATDQKVILSAMNHANEAAEILHKDPNSDIVELTGTTTDGGSDEQQQQQQQQETTNVTNEEI